MWFYNTENLPRDWFEAYFKEIDFHWRKILQFLALFAKLSDVCNLLKFILAKISSSNLSIST